MIDFGDFACLHIPCYTQKIFNDLPPMRTCWFTLSVGIVLLRRLISISEVSFTNKLTPATYQTAHTVLFHSKNTLVKKRCIIVLVYL